MVLKIDVSSCCTIFFFSPFYLEFWVIFIRLDEDSRDIILLVKIYVEIGKNGEKKIVLRSLQRREILIFKVMVDLSTRQIFAMLLKTFEFSSFS